ncbi:AAA family ATPase [Propionibacteriaceae bacterium Y1685]
MQVIFLNGSIGAGKSRTAEAMGRQLAAENVRHAVIDLDYVRLFWPAPDDDPFNQALEIENMTLLAQSFERHGATVLVLAGVLETTTDRTLYEEALGRPMSVHLLEVDPELALQRLAVRHADDDADHRDWHLQRHTELARTLHAAGTHDHLIALGTRTPADVAADVLGRR